MSFKIVIMDRIHLKVLVLFIVTGFLRVKIVRANTEVSRKVVHLSSHVILKCDISEKKGTKLWWFDGELLYFNYINTHPIEGVSLSENYSLVIQEVMFQHEGLFTCTCEGSPNVAYNLSVAVIPEVTLSFGNDTFIRMMRHSPEIIVIDPREPIEITCLAVGSRPPASLTWVVNDEDVSLDNPNVRDVMYTPNKERPNITDSTSTLHLLPSGDEVNVSCQFRGIEFISSNVTILVPCGIFDQHFQGN
ncbi:cell adhesion molecule 2-like isoform X3 [Apostichopus japonicus]|uniref:cell adhesion molecule 2-like isoform X3 n=1 Tax=Stichopus japonicus TaxID=307972 RepID=UPI003AB358F2